MQKLGHSRSALRQDHYVQTPDTFVRTVLPGMEKATAIVHTGPAAGARFIEYTAEMEPGGVLGPTHLQRFLYVAEGGIEVEGRVLGPGEFAYVAPTEAPQISAHATSRIVVVEKQFLGDAPPKSFFGSEAQVPSKPLGGDPSLQVRLLIPDDLEFDFALNTMTFEPGATLSQVEMHVMEHGLLMLEGAGIYRLGDSWYPVAAGDFIYMAPFCPQWFGALGKSPSKYLIYKDWNRHPDTR